MRKLLIFLLAGIVALLGLTACDNNGNYYSTICVNPYTHYRVAYSQCNVHSGWIYYIRDGSSTPKVGSSVSKYNKNNYKKPKSATIKTNSVPTKGGKVSVQKPKQNTNKGGNNKGGYNKPKAPVYRPRK